MTIRRCGVGLVALVVVTLMCTVSHGQISSAANMQIMQNSQNSKDQKDASAAGADKNFVKKTLKVA